MQELVSDVFILFNREMVISHNIFLSGKADCVLDVLFTAVF